MIIRQQIKNKVPFNSKNVRETLSPINFVNRKGQDVVSHKFYNTEETLSLGLICKDEGPCLGAMGDHVPIQYLLSMGTLSLGNIFNGRGQDIFQLKISKIPCPQ